MAFLRSTMFLRSTILGFSTLALSLGCGAPGASEGATTELQGELEVLIANYGDASGWAYALRTDAGERIEVEFDEPLGLVTGERVAVEVETADHGAFRAISWRRLAEDAEVGAHEEALVGQPVLRTRRVALLLVNWTAPNSMSVASGRATLFTNTNSVRNHFLESSYGQQEVTGDVFGWYSVPAPSGCNYNGIRDSALAAATAAGVNLTQFDHVAIYFPSFSSCGWSGLGQVGSPTRPARYTWYNGASGSVFSHELGHNFGLHHARSYNCGAPRIAPNASCTFSEYGDPFDPMGRGGLRHFSAYHKHIEGWFGGCNAVTVGATGTFDIVPTETASNSPQLLRVPMNPALCPPGITSCQYMLEYRQPIGFDATNGGVNGVLVYANAATARTSPFLLDMTPETANRFTDARLATGATFSDPNGVAITVVSASTAKATLRVTLPGATAASTCLDGRVWTGTP